MTPFQLISYTILAIIALYIAYIVAINLIGILWIFIKVIVYGTLLTIIVWFLYQNGFFSFLKRWIDSF